MEYHKDDFLYLTDLDKTSTEAISASQAFTRQAIKMMNQGLDLFPSLYGLAREKRRLMEVLMTGNGAILKGEFGVGKTELARSIYLVLKQFYEDTPVYFPQGCPVRENAFHLYQYKVKGVHEALHRVCPVCRHNYLDTSVNPSVIGLNRVYLSEGSGFARIQGNEDIEPERILGMYHLTRYAEIGDPFDPRALELGKIAHASGGALFVDELGLLNKEAQYALIQGLQEKQFTPSNSRMTFPIDFLFISTTNTINEFQIHWAIKNRLVGILIERLNFKNELSMAREKLEKLNYPVVFPEFLLEYLIESIRKLNNIAVYLGPRSSIRAAQMAEASALIDRRSVVDYCDVKEAIYTEVVGQSDQEGYEEVYEALKKELPLISDFLQEKIPFLGELSLSLGVRHAKTANISEEFDQATIEEILSFLPDSEQGREAIARGYLDAYFRNCA
jgi:MoxR-like ATPase